MDSLVSTDWLESELGAPDLRILDATLFLPGSGRDARAEYEEAHIPGARFLDLEEVSDPDSDLPHMMPPPHIFASRMQRLGIGDGNRIVLYDNSPLHSAARGWFMLHAYGAQTVALLDGGWQKWQAEGRPTESGRSAPRAGHFTARLDERRLIDKADLARLVGSPSVQIADARSAERFEGRGEEPRAGLSAGHIPGSRNLPQGEFFRADHRWKPPEELRRLFDAAGVDPSAPLVATCGSGITASVILFAAHLVGGTDGRLYDGSWAEWGADPAAPKAKGPA